MKNLLIIGQGPAGISAALYAVRAGIDTTIIAKDGGALENAQLIENYYGFENPISGAKLIEQGILQAKRMGVKFITDEVVGLNYLDNFVVIGKEDEYTATSIIIATGSARVTPKISGITEFEGKGVSYCAVCDAFFYRGKAVCVIGNGDYAIHEALELKAVASKVTLLTNGMQSPIVPDGIEVDTRKILAFTGDNVIQNVEFADGSLPINGAFIAIGVASSSDLARKIGAVVENGKISVDSNMATTVPGLYAAGDCIGGLLQIAKAVSDGAKASIEAIKFIRTAK